MPIPILEDDDGCREQDGISLHAAEVVVTCVNNFREAVHSVANGAKIGITPVDVRRPSGTPHGISFARMTQARRPTLEIVFMSVYANLRDLSLYAENESFLAKILRRARRQSDGACKRGDRYAYGTYSRQ